MRRIITISVLLSLILLAACVQTGSQQSIQDIVSNTKNLNQAPNQTKVNVTKNNSITLAVNASEPVELTNETPSFYKKCRYSTILFSGCKWTTKDQTVFTLKILSASKTTIPGTWFIISGESGGKLTIKRTEDILAGGARTYTIDYTKLTSEIGRVTRFEVFPIEVINDTEYACLNMEAPPFIPDTHCKPSEPVRLNDDGSVNTTG